MPKFDRFHVEALKKYLYNSYVHDAKIDAINYDSKEKKLTIRTVNSIYNNTTNLTFEKVNVIMSICGNGSGSHSTILSLTVEEDYSCVQDFAKICCDSLLENIYLLFQMFNGDELHIVSRSVFIEMKE